jgi:hypothetical protein
MLGINQFVAEKSQARLLALKVNASMALLD